ncbi:Stk1 family PASTA domain-containing Ser/Thr kinase [Paraconexibacter algicola]|uniref:PASTA domain-containing protein n=1 Tax=Paraconexibacter algicola TaxID=2133960 RepID=A0A2T4ULE6_9ACTN|nr:Stk1 family PASTA domain-containing Ser/Thr kinase [Paraconexibacter algicola]PTL60069.1 hypothetical protein C7Y72_10650 [Paraconexibacter algicola]
MSTPPSTRRPGGLRARVGRRPLTWLSAVVLAALLVGVAIGQTDTVLAADLSKARSVNTRLQADLDAERRRATDAERARDTAVAKADRALAEARRITARGKVPSFQGQDVDTARDRAVVDDFDWRVTQRSSVSRAEPGTVIAQRPSAGRTLARGGTIELVVAKKPPPRPKQWVTIYSLDGAGSKRTGEFRIPGDVKVRVRYTFGGDSNDTLQLKTPEEGDDSFGDLIVNEIGPFSGSTRLYGKSGTYYFDVNGGSWTIEVQAFKRP